MKKRGWIALLCGLLAVCPALAEQTDGVVRVGEVTYDVQTVQNSLNAGYQLYESSGISLSAAQKQQLADSVLERFVGLGVLENQLRKEGQAEIDEQTRQALDEQARQAYEAAWQQMAEAIRSGTPDATDEQISAFLTHMGYTLDAYRQEAELTLKNQRLIALYCGDISVTDQEVQDYYEQQYVSVYRARYEDDIPLFEQEVLLSDLKAGKGSEIKAAIADGKTFLTICGGYQMLGSYYETYDGQRCDFIGALDLYTVGSKTRMIGNYKFKCGEAAGGSVVVGFENHSGKTHLGRGVEPLGTVLAGFGNNGEDGTEGAHYKNVFGTYSHGPMLPKNPEFCDMLLATALERRYGKAELAPLDDTLELLAHDEMCARVN